MTDSLIAINKNLLPVIVIRKDLIKIPSQGLPEIHHLDPTYTDFCKKNHSQKFCFTNSHCSRLVFDYNCRVTRPIKLWNKFYVQCPADQTRKYQRARKFGEKIMLCLHNLHVAAI